MAKRGDEEQDKAPSRVTDIEAISSSARDAVARFNERWMPLPKMVLGCEVFTPWQLRDAMGLRATQDYGDPWPAVERQLLDLGFCWHTLGGQRVMYLMERENCVDADDWQEAEEDED